MMAAGRGIIGLLIGNRAAPAFFDFSTRGLVGSFIAFVAVSLLNGALPMALGVALTPGAITRALIFVAIGYTLQLAFAAIVLRQVGKLDRLKSFLVADNWGSFFVILIMAALSASSLIGIPVYVVFAILSLVIEVNIARLIIGLPGIQVATFVIARLAAAFISVMLAQSIGLIAPILDASLG
jgi:hypothetical protein